MSESDATGAVDGGKVLIRTGATDELLTAVAEPVSADELGGADLDRLAEILTAAMTAAGGLGLAAPQIGASVRVFVLAKSLGASARAFVNPRLVQHGRDVVPSEERCLSLPGYAMVVNRWRIVTVEAEDTEGRTFKRILRGAAARAAQHELDHLDGILIVDPRAGVNPATKDDVRDAA